MDPDTEAWAAKKRADAAALRTAAATQPAQPQRPRSKQEIATDKRVSEIRQVMLDEILRTRGQFDAEFDALKIDYLTKPRRLIDTSTYADARARCAQGTDIVNRYSAQLKAHVQIMPQRLAAARLPLKAQVELATEYGSSMLLGGNYLRDWIDLKRQEILYTMQLLDFTQPRAVHLGVINGDLKFDGVVETKTLRHMQQNIADVAAKQRSLDAKIEAAVQQKRNEWVTR
jgi:hypothetical protein